MPRKTSAKKVQTKSRSKKVHVVMGNDFPDTVWKMERAARDYAHQLNASDSNSFASGRTTTRIYYVVYSMELR